MSNILVPLNNDNIKNILPSTLAAIGISAPPQFVINDPTAGEANSAALQAALDNRGYVLIATQGTVYFSARSVIYSDTLLSLDPLFNPIMTDGSLDNWLVNNCYNNVVNLNTGFTAIAANKLTAVGQVVTLDNNGVAHGRVVGDKIFVNLAGERGYAGIFEVVTVPTSTTLTYRAYARPLSSPAPGVTIASPASYQVLSWGPADKNIAVICNRAKMTINTAGNGGAAGSRAGMMMYFFGCANLVLDNPYITSNVDPSVGATSMSFGVSNCGDIKIRTPYFNQVASGGHIQGPWKRLEITDVTGDRMTDDGFSLSDKTAAAFPQFALTEGDMFETIVDGVNINGAKQLAIYANSATYLNRFKLKNIHGTASDLTNSSSSAGITVWTDAAAPNSPIGAIDQFECETDWAGGQDQAAIAFSRVTVTTPKIKTNVRQAVSTGSAKGYIRAQYSNLIDSELSVRCVELTNASYDPIVTDLASFSGDLTFSNCHIEKPGCVLWQQAGGVVDKLTHRGIYSHHTLLVQQSSGTIKHHCYGDLHTLETTNIFQYSGTCYKSTCLGGWLAEYCHDIIKTPPNAIQIDGGGIIMYGAGNVIGTQNGSVVTNKLNGVSGEDTNFVLTGTATMLCQSFDIRADLSPAGVLKTLGAFATHTGVTNKGPAIANGTGFYSQAQGAAVPALCA